MKLNLLRYYKIDFTYSFIQGPRCNGYPKTQWDCCNPHSQCGVGEGDCDSDDDCVGDLICGNSRDDSNNCATTFANNSSLWMEKADCCINPGKRYWGVPV